MQIESIILIKRSITTDEKRRKLYLQHVQGKHILYGRCIFRWRQHLSYCHDLMPLMLINMRTLLPGRSRIRLTQKS